MDRHTCSLSPELLARSRKAAQSLWDALKATPSTIDGTVQCGWNGTNDPQPAVLDLVPAKDMTAHGQLAIVAHTPVLFEAVTAWAAQCPILWANLPIFSTKHTNDGRTGLFITLTKGRPVSIDVAIPKPNGRGVSHRIVTPIDAKGTEFLRLATFLGAIEGPFRAWTSVANSKEEVFFAGGPDTVALMDRIVRAARTTLKSGKAGTPPAMRYTEIMIPTDAQAVLDRVVAA